MKRIVAGVLEVAYLETGPADGEPVILLHGFPYDVHAYDEVAERLAAAGRRCIVPYLRGYGPTRFLSADTPRSGEQAALGADLLALMEALQIPRAVLAGYDWGGRAACIVAALWPERVRGLVSSGSGYNIQNIAGAGRPAAPEQEHRFWYQYYFHSERGRAGLTANRRALCHLLWKLWSPSWDFDDATSSAAPSPSTIRILSTSSSIPTAIASAAFPVIRRFGGSRRSSRASPASRLRPSCSRAPTTASIRRRPSTPTRRTSPALTSGGRFSAPATTCRRRSLPRMPRAVLDVTQLPK
jgi:pimeloyl-ACP methyl ester carboxylesterase